MDRKQIRKLISRLLRHSGFIVKMNKETQEYEFFLENAEQPILYCRSVIEDPETEGNDLEVYLCFRSLNELSSDVSEKYQRMLNRFKRLAPSININYENESEPIFTKEQEEKLKELVKEYENNEGD